MFLQSPSQVRATAELERRRRDADSDGKSDYQRFQQKYRHDLAGFALDCVDWRGDQPADYQLEAMRRFVKKRRFTIRGPHGLGKTMLVSLVVLWFALTRDGEDWKVPTLASAWRQLIKFLWPEIHKWSRRLRWDVIGRKALRSTELFTLSLKLSTGSAFAITSEEPAFIEGAHADNILYIFDESKAIPDDIWDAAEGAMASGEAYWLAVSTPGEPSGRFYDIHKRKPGYDDWDVVHVTIDQAIAAGRINGPWAAKRLEQWGADSAVYQNRVLGEFAANDEDGVIPLAWLERSNQRWLIRRDTNDWGDYFGVGGDVGRGGDPSVLAWRYGMAIKKLEHFHENEIMGFTGRVAAAMRLTNTAISVIDVTGIGSGVVDRLRELPDIAGRVYAFIAGGKVSKRDESGEIGFVDMRSAGYWEVRELLSRDEIDLPPDDKLTGDLTLPKYKYESGGRIRVESKDIIKKRIGRSTDDGDATIMIFMDRYSQHSDFGGLGTVEDYESPWA